MTDNKNVPPALYAYIHQAQSGALHLRVRQPPMAQMQADAVKHALHRVGSPANWDSSAWEWDYPLTAAAVVTLQRAAKQIQLDIQYADDLVAFASEQAKNEDYEEKVRLSIERLNQDKAAVIPGYVTNSFNGAKPPKRHQQIAYHWGVRVTGLMLAHDPGVGKTRSSCDIMRGWYDNNIIRPMEQIWIPKKRVWGVRYGVLIVCTNNMQDNWKDEMMQWQGMTGLIITGVGKAPKLLKAGMLAHAHIVNYESMAVVKGNEYDAVIFDEIHRCANNSNQTENSMFVVQGTRRRLGLTGTLVANRLESIFFPMLLIDGGKALGASKKAFLEKWFTNESPHPGARPVVTPNDGALEEVSQAMSRCTHFVKKEEVLHDLPAKAHVSVTIQMTPEQEKYYESVKKETLTYIEDGSVTIEQTVARMMKLRQICQGFVIDDNGQTREFSSGKINALVDILQNVLYGRKVVVWCAFTNEIDRLCVKLHEMGLGYVRLDGQVSSRVQRKQVMDLWNKHPQVQVFIGQIQMGIGITLHANECEVPCFECIYVGIDWSYVNWIQSQDRIHRIGQVYPCTYRYLLTPDGVDRRIYHALRAKAQTSDAVIRLGKDFYKSLLTNDVENLAALD